jgi:hypothetical protein
MIIPVPISGTYLGPFGSGGGGSYHGNHNGFEGRAGDGNGYGGIGSGVGAGGAAANGYGGGGGGGGYVSGTYYAGGRGGNGAVIFVGIHV